MALEKYVIPCINCDEDWFVLTGQRETLSKKQQEEQGHRHRGTVFPIKANQLLVIDVYTEWSGPCNAVESHLRRLRHSFVEAPDTLALARACCDHITDLQPFKHDIRPTFLFWARGKSVALLRGANRPLLTRLINDEVAIEAKQLERRFIDIDFYSDKVIQCQGDLANLESDEVIRSIGKGNTDRLSIVFNIVDSKRKSPNMEESEQELLQCYDNEDGFAATEGETGFANRDDVDSENDDDDKDDDDEEENDNPDENHPDDMVVICQQEDNGDDEGGFEGDFINPSSDEDEYEDEPVLTETQENNNDNKNPGLDNDELVNPFGKRRKKKKKKMETGLLKEILDFKPAKRFGH